MRTMHIKNYIHRCVKYTANKCATIAFITAIALNVNAQNQISARSILFSEIENAKHDYTTFCLALYLLDSKDDNIDTTVTQLELDSSIAAQEMLFRITYGKEEYEQENASAYGLLSGYFSDYGPERFIQTRALYAVQNNDSTYLQNLKDIPLSNSAYPQSFLNQLFKRYSFKQFIFPHDLIYSSNKKGLIQNSKATDAPLFSIYPNPTTSTSATIEVRQFNELKLNKTYLKIFSINGRLVRNLKLNQSQFAINAPRNKGVYFVILEEMGTIKSIRKWIVQ